MFNVKVNTYTLNEADKRIAFLASLCLFLSAIEFVIPKPLPFMRLGLANLPIILSLYILKPKQVFFLIFLKVLGQGFISGTLFSYILLFSLLGSFSSGIIMYVTHKLVKSNISFMGICLLGSLANASSQIILSDLLLFGDTTRYIAPLLIINACVTGLLLGAFLTKFSQHSKWYKATVININKEVYSDD